MVVEIFNNNSSNNPPINNHHQIIKNSSAHGRSHNTDANTDNNNNNNDDNDKNITNNNNYNNLNKEQLQLIKSNFLSPNEVTFRDVSSDDDDDDDDDACSIVSKETPTKTLRKRLSSTDTGDADSIISTEKKKPNIPDGGFGWVVVFSSLLLSLIADGISFSFGLLYTEFLNYFQASKSKTAWIGSLFLAIPLLSGPIMSNLVDKYGCRYMTIIGGIVSGIGFALASISNSVEMLYLTFGVIAGLGLGIGYVTAVVSIAFWFDKKRTFATGIGASGTGVGTFLYAPFTQWLLETYGWRGTTLILAGTLFNICICGALMRDPDWLIEQNRLESRSQSMTTFSNSSVCLDEIKKMLETGAPKEAVLDTLMTNYNTEANQQIPDPEITNVSKKYQSLLLLPTYMGSQEFANSNIRHGSRRSLRKKPQDTVVSKDDILLIPNPKQNLTVPLQQEEVELIIETKNKEWGSNTHLASAETLISDEVFFDNDDDDDDDDNDNEQLQKSPMSSTNSLGYVEFRKKYETKNGSKLNGSRLSLDESSLMSNSNGMKEARNVKLSYRGTSLDVLFESDGGYKSELSSVLPITNSNDNNNNNNNNNNLIENNDKNSNDIVIPIPSNFQFNTANKSHHQRNRHAANRQSAQAALKRNAILRNSNYFRNMRIHRNSIHYRGAMLNTHRYRLRASSCPNIYRNSMTTLAREDEDKWYDSFADILKSVFDFSLFLDIKFCCIQLSTLLLFTWFIVPYFYITEHMLTYGYKEDDAALLISLIGAFNTIGMISLGWIGDQPWLNVPKTYAVCLVVCGFSICMMPIVVENYILLMIFSVLFGITFASSFSFTPIILVNLTDINDFTCAYGLVLLVQGVGNLIGPPLAGFMFELTLSWDSSFYASGFFIAIAGVLAYITGILVDREENRKKSETDESSISDVEK